MTHLFIFQIIKIKRIDGFIKVKDNRTYKLEMKLLGFNIIKMKTEMTKLLTRKLFLKKN
jgi:hypothetical protein